MSSPRCAVHVSLAVFLLTLVMAVWAPTALCANRITGPVNESDLIQLTGNTHPLALAKFDRGAVSDTLPMEHMFLILRRSPNQEQALETLMAEQQNPRSSNYHKWLSAEELGTRFGPSQKDVETVVDWLQSHGLRVNVVYPSAMAIDFSGTAGQVKDAFHTEIHNYNVNGEAHIANATDPKIPAALAPVVHGVKALHDFMPKPLVQKPSPDFSFNCVGCPDGFDNQELYLEGPGDFATIYNATPTYDANITGAGQTIAVLEDTNILKTDWTKFRSAFGLSSYGGTFEQIHPVPPSGSNDCSSPGTNADEFEAALDAEWTGAAAPGADIELASCADTSVSFGGDTAAYNLINSATPPQIISYSYGECEAFLGSSGNAFYNVTWQQAAAEGVSMFVAAGDWGAAVCDASFAEGVYALDGIAVNGLASTPYNLAAGGTDFSDVYEGTTSTYWNTTNTSARESAISYIPEMTWNDSCGGSVLAAYYGYSSNLDFCNSSIGSNFINIVAGSGGFSFVYPKPSWQSIYGNPTDGDRDLPDVSLFASNGFWFQAIALCMSDSSEGGSPCDYKTPVDAFFNSGGGTSFVAPQLAGVQALINQKAGGAQGNPAPIYYQLAASAYGVPGSPNNSTLSSCNSSKGNKVGSTCIFHDVTLGNDDVPCYGANDCYVPSGDQYGVLSTSDKSLQEAYKTKKGWDFATGIGSINVTNVVNNWPAPTTASSH
jgi:subtilase family serine protease